MTQPVRLHILVLTVLATVSILLVTAFLLFRSLYLEGEDSLFATIAFVPAVLSLGNSLFVIGKKVNTNDALQGDVRRQGLIILRIALGLSVLSFILLQLGV